MNKKEFKKLSISNLLLILLNENVNEITKQSVLIELQKRIKNIDVEIKDLMRMEKRIIDERGDDANSYLTGPNPSMQQLMELYFSYLYAPEQDKDYLLLSEFHLCNDMNLWFNFFDKICKYELVNLSKRINKVDSEIEREILIIVKDILSNRKQKIKTEGWNDNKALYLFWETNMELWYNNPRDEDSLLCIFEDSIAEGFGEIFLENDIINEILSRLYMIKVIIKDSSKLNKQKRILLNQVKNGYEVNYLAKPIQQSLSRVRNINKN